MLDKLWALLNYVSCPIEKEEWIIKWNVFLFSERKKGQLPDELFVKFVMSPENHMRMLVHKKIGCVQVKGEEGVAVVATFETINKAFAELWRD